MGVDQMGPLTLYGNAIDRTGVVHGKGGRAGKVSDWSEIERIRSISITQVVLWFEHGSHLINLFDTPGH